MVYAYDIIPLITLIVYIILYVVLRKARTEARQRNHQQNHGHTSYRQSKNTSNIERRMLAQATLLNGAYLVRTFGAKNKQNSEQMYSHSGMLIDVLCSVYQNI